VNVREIFNFNKMSHHSYGSYESYGEDYHRRLADEDQSDSYDYEAAGLGY
jgi:hypothetical protein